MKSDAIVIKKYGNRRLYDTSRSRYIKLEEIATLIRNGKQVRVVDARTNQDLTRVTLTQIIVEDAKGGPTGLPLELLRHLIVASDRAGRDFVMWHLNSAFEAYQKVRKSLQRGLSEVGSVAFSPLQMLNSSTPDDRADNEALRRRVAQLEARLSKSTRRRRRRPATS